MKIHIEGWIHLEVVLVAVGMWNEMIWWFEREMMFDDDEDDLWRMSIFAARHNIAMQSVVKKMTMLPDYWLCLGMSV